MKDEASLKAQNHYSKSRLLQLVVAKTPTNILGVLQHFLPTNCANVLKSRFSWISTESQSRARTLVQFTVPSSYLQWRFRCPEGLTKLCDTDSSRENVVSASMLNSVMPVCRWRQLCSFASFVETFRAPKTADWNRRRASEVGQGSALVYGSQYWFKRIYFSGHAQFVGRKCCSTPSILVGVLATTSCTQYYSCYSGSVPSDLLRLHVISFVTLDLEQRIKVALCTHTITSNFSINYWSRIN